MTPRDLLPPMASERPLHPEALALLLADARLPVAGHTQSAGLEPALVAGPVDVPAYVALRLRTVTRTEAATAVVARAAVLGGTSLEAVQDAWAVRTPSAAMRRTSRVMGRALVRLAPRLVAAEHVALLPCEPVRPVVLGLLAAVGGLDAATTARIVGYDDIQTVVAAALKLTPLDPAEATGWVVRAFPALEGLVAGVVDLACPEEIPARNAPVIEDHAERHAHTTRRLFSA
ncbi:urease accessory protein UreF [Nocardioides gilvus]|uniref:urease accessory protein UreF n=1 Tax=Nocardioides gilvus TaxID=1735589 RepID=UPI001EF4F3E8|nr:urease accessory UreF family protein [Nocardioides gilvus]